LENKFPTTPASKCGGTSSVVINQTYDVAHCAANPCPVKTFNNITDCFNACRQETTCLELQWNTLVNPGACTLYSTTGTNGCELERKSGYSVYWYQQAPASTSRTVARETSIAYQATSSGSADQKVGMRASEKCTWVIRTQTGAPTLKAVSETGYKMVNTQST